MYHLIRLGMMGLTQTAISTIDRTELELSTTLKSNELLIRIIALARLELDRVGDGVAVVVLRPIISHNSETQRSINHRTDGTTNFSELLITGR